MNKKVWPYVIMMLAGLALAFVGHFVVTDEGLKGVSGACIGIGFGSLGLAVARIVTIITMRKNPEYARRQSIEEHDERNIVINEKAKAKGFDTIWITFCITMLCLIIMKVDIPVVLVVVGGYIAVNVVQLYYLSKFSAEL